MQNFLRLIKISAPILLLLFVAACSNPLRQAPPPSFGEIRVVGVLPILVDADSIIEHPARDEVVKLLQRHNSGQEARLVKAMEKTDRFFDVRPVSGTPGQFFGWLLDGGEWGGPVGKEFRSYRFHPGVVKQLAGGAAADALLAVVLQGVKQPAKQWDRTGFHYLEADFNLIQAVAILVDGEGRIQWQGVVPLDPPFLFLQHPDFDAAYYNRSEQVPVRFLTLSGLDLALTEGKRSLFSIGNENDPYHRLAAGVAEELKSFNFSGRKADKHN